MRGFHTCFPKKIQRHVWVLESCVVRSLSSNPLLSFSHFLESGIFVHLRYFSTKRLEISRKHVTKTNNYSPTYGDYKKVFMRIPIFQRIVLFLFFINVYISFSCYQIFIVILKVPLNDTKFKLNSFVNATLNTMAC